MDILESAVREYVRELKQINHRNDKELFGHYSYSKWAAIEVLNEHNKHPEIPPFELVNLMADKFDRYAQLSVYGGSYMFSTAKDACDYLANMLLDERRYDG